MTFAKHKNTSLAVQLTLRELSTILAALRFWQRKGSETSTWEMEIARDGGTIKHALSNGEIDMLFIALNTGDRDVVPMPAALTRNLTSAQDLDVITRAQPYEAMVDKDRRALVLKHRNHALKLTLAGVWCKKCMMLVIEDAEGVKRGS